MLIMDPNIDSRELNKKKAKKLFVIGGLLISTPFVLIFISYLLSYIFNSIGLPDGTLGSTGEFIVEGIDAILFAIVYLGWFVLIPVAIVLWVIAFVISLRR